MIRSIVIGLLFFSAVFAVPLPTPINPLEVNFDFPPDPFTGPGAGDAIVCGPTTTACTTLNNRIATDLPAVFTIDGIEATNTIGVSWGDDGARSSLAFLPVKGVTVTDAPFLLGVFVHFNFPININEILDSATVAFSLETNGNPSAVHLVEFAIDETSNEDTIGDCPNYTPHQLTDVPCPDAVIGGFPGVIDVDLGGGQIIQLILSFRAENDINSAILDFVKTQENELTPGYLFAEYVQVTTAEQTTRQQTTQQQTTQQQTTQQQTTAPIIQPPQTTAATTSFDPNGEYCCQWRTQTRGGWSNVCRGKNPGCILDAGFGTGTAFPSISLGCEGNILYQFTTPDQIRAFFRTNPSGPNQIVAQTLALEISVGMDIAYEDFSTCDKNLDTLCLLTGDCAGWTIRELLTAANYEIGDCECPAEIADLCALSRSTLTGCLDLVNNNFVDGVGHQGNVGLCEGDQLWQICPAPERFTTAEATTARQLA